MLFISRIKLLSNVFKQAASAWWNDNAPMLGAAIAYYAMISLSPLLVITIAIGGAVFGSQAASGEIVAQIRGLIGNDSAQAVQNLIASAHQTGRSWQAGLVGGLTLLIGAGGVFVQLQEALNTIWAVHPKPGVNWGPIVRKYCLSFGLVVGTGFLLLVSLVVSAGLAAFGRFIAGLWPEYLMTSHAMNTALSLGIIALLFACIFRFLPDVVLAWHDVWSGAFVASFLFTMGKAAIGFYLGHSGIASTYGAAGSLVVVLVWVYYSTQILLFGVEFTKCYKQQARDSVVPEAHAKRI